MLVLSDPADPEKARREREMPCPRCERKGAAQPTLRTSYVTFYRCATCGHMWVTKQRSE